MLSLDGIRNEAKGSGNVSELARYINKCHFVSALFKSSSNFIHEVKMQCSCVSGEFLTEVDRNYHVIIYQTNSLIGRGPCHDAVLSNRRLFSKRVKSSIVNVYKCIGEKNPLFREGVG